MRIFLIRHGQSLGNVNDNIYADVQDHNVPLTDIGREQSRAAGKFLKEYFASRKDLKNKKKHVRVWYSPFKRAVETKDELLNVFGSEHIEAVRENHILREQNFGIFSDIPNEEDQKKKFPEEFKKYQRCRDTNGKFYAVPPDGESRAEVADRMQIFVSQLIRKHEEDGVEDFFIVAHGVTNRAFEMVFMPGRDVAWFEKEPNPGNCDIMMIEGELDKGFTATYIYKDGKATPAAALPPKASSAFKKSAKDGRCKLRKAFAGKCCKKSQPARKSARNKGRGNRPKG